MLRLEYHNAVARYLLSNGTYRFELRKNFESVVNTLFPIFVKLFEECSIGSLIDFKELGFELLKYVRKNKIAKEILEEYIKENGHKSLRNIVMFLVLKIFEIEILFPILSDVMVNEIYMDRANERIYIDHALVGRVDTEVKLNNAQVDKLMLFAKIYGDALIAGINPSAKIDLLIDDQRLRISICLLYTSPSPRDRG